MPDINLDKIDWDKGEGLVPAIVQNIDNGQILMLAYMDRAALAQTISSKKVTFFSRSKNRLWTKGETSGNWLDYISGEMDCDADTLLIQARPQGPSCHTGSVTCFNDQTPSNIGFLDQLGTLIARTPQNHARRQLYNKPICRRQGAHRAKGWRRGGRVGLGADEG